MSVIYELLLTNSEQSKFIRVLETKSQRTLTRTVNYYLKHGWFEKNIKIRKWIPLWEK